MRVEPIRQDFWLRLFDGPGGCKDPLGQSQPLDFEPLPLEVWEAVFRAATPGSLCTLRAACRGWRERLDSAPVDALWEAAYHREWPGRALHGAWVDASNLWRMRFLARWWAHGRWGARPPTICTLMGKKAHGGTVTCVALGACGVDSGECTALSASDDASLFCWRFARAPGTHHGHALAGSPHAVAQQHHRQCQGVDVRCPQRLKQFYGHSGPVWCLWFDPDRDRVLSGGYDQTVKLWSFSGERCEATLRGHDGWVRSLEVLQAGRFVVSGSSDGILKLWSLETLQPQQTWGPPNGDPRHSTHCLSALEGQGVLLSGHNGVKSLMRWDLESTQFLESFTGHDDDVYTIHADGSTVVSGSKDRTVRIWDARLPGGRCVGTLRGHTGAVLDLKFRGNRVASASMDKTVRMWDLRTLQTPLATLEGHSAEVHCVDFNDRMVLSGSRDTSLKVWTVV